MIYYKVVLRKNKKLYSSFAHMFHHTPVHYRIGKWVKSRDKKRPLLFVTTSLDHAKNILCFDIQSCQKKEGAIYECEVSQTECNEFYLTAKEWLKEKLDVKSVTAEKGK